MSDVTQTVEQELRDYAKTQAGTRVSRTIAALTRSDRDRVTFWDGTAVVDRQAIQSLYAGDEEATVFFAVERYHELRAAIGFVAIDGYPMQSGAWLVVNGTGVIDPAGNGRTLTGLLGVEMGAVEASLWTPTQRSAVAERGVSRLAV